MSKELGLEGKLRLGLECKSLRLECNRGSVEDGLGNLGNLNNWGSIDDRLGNLNNWGGIEDGCNRCNWSNRVNKSVLVQIFGESVEVNGSEAAWSLDQVANQRCQRTTLWGSQRHGEKCGKDNLKQKMLKV